MTTTTTDITPSLIEYVATFAAPTLGKDRAALITELSSPTSTEVFRTFATDPNRGQVYLVRTFNNNNNNNASDSSQLAVTENELQVSLFLDTVAGVTEATTEVLTFYKRNVRELEADKPLNKQILFSNVYMDSVTDILYRQLSATFSPILSLVTLDGDAGKYNNSIVSSVNELVTNLKCHQRFAFADVNIMKLYHPEILKICQTAGDVAVDELADRATEGKDKSFFSEVHKTFHSITKEVQSVCETHHTITSVREEVMFWDLMEKTAGRLEQQINSREMEVTLRILRNGGRISVFNLEKELGVQACKQRARDYTAFLHDFPINLISGATTMEDLRTASVEVFSHIRRIKTMQYPPQRALTLMDCVMKEFTEMVVTLLRQKNLLSMPYENFESTAGACGDAFGQLELDYRKFYDELASLTKKKSEKVHLDHLRVKNRVASLKEFREHHDALIRTLVDVFPTTEGSVNAIEDAQQAFQTFSAIEAYVLDTTQDGDARWKASCDAYETAIECVESNIVTRLKSRLSTATTASEMFRVFSQFNLLFFRPKIKLALQQYQSDLISKVKEDVQVLHEKFTTKYHTSQTAQLTALRDVPPVSGFIMWVRQLERQLNKYLKRVDDVYGKGWERIKVLRKMDGTWSLNEGLARFMGVELSILRERTRAILRREGVDDIWGTAFAISFVELVFRDEKSEWDAMVSESKQIIRQMELKYSLVGGVHKRAFDLLEELGVGEQHVEESEMRKECAQFRNKMNDAVNKELERWNNLIKSNIATRWEIFVKTSKSSEAAAKIGSDADSREEISIRGSLFKVVHQGPGVHTLIVNFNPEIHELIKEMRTMKCMGLMTRIHFQVTSASIAATEFLVPALALNECLTLFYSVQKRVRDDFKVLVAGEQQNIHKQLSTGVYLQWESEMEVQKVSNFIRNFHKVATAFSEKVDNVTQKMEKLSKVLESLKTCAVLKETFYQHVMQAQKIVDSLVLSSCSNVDFWLYHLNKKVEAILLDRLTTLINSFIEQFESLDPSRAREFDEDSDKPLLSNVELAPIHCEVKLQGRAIVVEPSIQYCREKWLYKLHSVIAWVCDIPRLTTARYDQGGSHRINYRETYANVFSDVKSELQTHLFTTIEKRITMGTSFLMQWRRYQALWDMDISMAFDRLGTDIESWLRLLAEIRSARDMMASSETTKHFGAMIIDFRNVQQKVASQYDHMSRQFVDRFRSILGKQMQTFYANVGEERRRLENIDLVNSTDDMFAFLSDIPRYLRMREAWTKEIESCVKGQSMLHHQRAKLPDTWLDAQMVESEWKMFAQLLERRLQALEEKRELMKEIARTDAEQIEKRVEAVAEEWKESKPEGSQIRAPEAMKTIGEFDVKVKKIVEDARKTMQAQEALGLPTTSMDRIDVISEDVDSNRQLWSKLSEGWEVLDELGAQPFSEVNPKKLGQSLRELEDTVRNFPGNVRTFAPYDNLLMIIRTNLKANGLISDLRSDAIHDRHWSLILSQVKTIKWRQKDATVGQLWGADLMKHEKTLRNIIRNAQGELAIENYLKGIRQAWDEYALEFANYQQRVFLIKGWDAIFEKLTEHLNALNSMRMSPYFKEFEVQAKDWDDKLNNVRSLFEVWVEVQRRWVYLEGIFTGSADIKLQLPNESAKFQQINNDFLPIMKKAHKESFVLRVFSLDKIRNTLEKIHRELVTVQKALGEYLENQRSSFPRFYFVGDEDLLEIIGNAKNPPEIAKHFKKMFCGITAMHMAAAQDGSYIVQSMLSSEGESVGFVTPVTTNKRINEWLNDIEGQMQTTLQQRVNESLADVKDSDVLMNATKLTEWVSKYPSQVVCLAIQMIWSMQMENQIAANALDKQTKTCEDLLALLSTLIGGSPEPIQRRKYEQMITIMVYQRDVTRRMAAEKIMTPKDFSWLCCMRFMNGAIAPNAGAAGASVNVHIADAVFAYSFEYLGIGERLVQTPLTDKCYLTLTQAMHNRLGGSPFGPAGTGKTETVKALGNQLGRFVLVFNCDENFDFKAMGRIFVGLCQVGAWGCFDEFNRLEERILSAVSQQIQTIQEGLKNKRSEVEVVNGTRAKLHHNVGIFITMNPGYAGRSNLPDNLKQLFRSVAMVAPDRENIAEVMLFSQGFKSAERIAKKVVPLFKLCKDQLSPQEHYDFGLRALKSVLNSSGSLKRSVAHDVKLNEQDEMNLLLQSVCDTMLPKLVAEDIGLFESLLQDVFPDVSLPKNPAEGLIEHIQAVCKDKNLVLSDMWLKKIIQVYQIQAINHGLMLVGPSGSGKTAAWTTLLRALARFEDVDCHAYIIDPKAISKSELYGLLDSTTRDWQDGIFTMTLRRIIDNVKGDDQSKKRHWIIFDGDVDPEWVENMNSLLDDNKLLTLPNGERLALPSNVRIVFEVQDLRFATPATVSRCGMVWFSNDVVTVDMLLSNIEDKLRTRPIVSSSHDDALAFSVAERGTAAPTTVNELTQDQEEELEIQRQVADVLHPYLVEDGFFSKCIAHASTSVSQHSIMEWNCLQSVTASMAIVKRAVRMLVETSRNQGLAPSPDVMEKYITRKLLLAIIWGMSGSSPFARRLDFANEILRFATIDVPMMMPTQSILDFDVNVIDAEWVPWKNSVPTVELPAHKIGTNDVVIPTVDTVRHEDIIGSWLFSQHPVLLCGPPGSGKTMTLTAVLRSNPDYDAVFLNFSSATQPEMVLKAFDQYCTYKQTVNGTILTPTSGKILVVFCDEINLPAMDKYGTQRIISFMRQLTERRGFYRPKDFQWVSLDRIQFVGACNPPTDPGRVPLTHRFLRWAPLILVDFPSHDSLVQIYSTFCRSLLKHIPPLRSSADPLTNMMVTYYEKNQERFTPDVQRHYVYSPRELSRWSRAVYEGIISLDDISQQAMTVENLVRLTAHEGLRLFQDRLVDVDERQWTDDKMDEVVNASFSGIDTTTALERPILYSTLLTRAYTSVTRDDLRKYVQGRLKTFSDEELEVQLVIFDSVLDHIIRIDRIMRQPLGHMLLVGVSGAGKTVLSKFVAWLNNLSVFQIKAHRGYTLEDFEEDLRALLKRAGCKGEKICFIFDESNIMDSGFLEYMNALLASGDVPGLFEGDDRVALMSQIREGIAAQPSHNAALVDIKDEGALYKWFVTQISNNLHVVFTMNPQSPDFYNRTATSPALFNRCTIDWFGEWSRSALHQVAQQYTMSMDLLDAGKFDDVSAAQAAVVSSMVRFHETTFGINTRLRRQGAGRGTFITPRHYLDFIVHFKSLFQEKREDLQEQQKHLNVGLSKLRETESLVENLKRELEVMQGVLTQKQAKGQEMLTQIVSDTQETEKGKQAAEALAKILEVQNVELVGRRGKAEDSLAEAQPALDDAEQALTTIKPDYLREIRAYTTPPPMVKKVLESVLTLLGEKNAREWDTIKTFLRRDDFIPNVKAFKPTSIPEDVKERVKKMYLSDKDFTYDNAMRGSKAAGPLQKWVSAQVRYAEILISITPLRAEIESLSIEYETKKAELDATQADINEKDEHIKRLKEEYSAVVQESNEIKSQITTNTEKFDRATTLMKSLMSERVRWEHQVSSFKTQMASMVGDCLVCAGYIAYIGYFDEHVRHKKVMPYWVDHLDEVKIPVKQQLSVVEFLSSPDQRLKWSANKLPTDDLCVENAVILRRYHRYPLIVDPSGIAVEFLMNEYKDKNMTKTSFLDPGFMKQLEMALRFGNPLLVQDVENIDPILNPILNKEVRRSGGRFLIRLGDQDIDLSPSFALFMTTRDSTFQFAPDLCGRVTFVNFTITPSSLHSQCLNRVLLSERPEVERRRSDVLKLQGEYNMRLRVLEQELLRAISEAEGNILEHTTLIRTLENLKTQSKEVERAMEESETSIQEINEVSNEYLPIAVACSKTYFTLSQLCEVNHLYQFSLNFFFNLVSDSIPKLGEGTPQLRIRWTLRNLFCRIYERVSRAMLHSDHLAFALRLSQIRTELDFELPTFEAEEWDLMLKLGSSSNESNQDSFPAYLSPVQRGQLGALVVNPYFGVQLRDSLAKDKAYWEGLPANTDVIATFPSTLWGEKTHPVTQAFRILVTLKVVRPDLFPAVAENFVRAVFDADMKNYADAQPFFAEYDHSLSQIETNEADPYSPILLCSTAGYDASFKVEELARSLDVNLYSIAIGSAEGFDEAEKAINAATRTGTWVLLKNVHLSPQYLQTLEKRLHALQLERKTNDRFRLFMTSEVNPKLPSNLIVRSIKLVFEPPPGVRSNLSRTFNKEAKLGGAVEKNRVVFLVGWLHAVVLERRRYLPLGWSKAYEFGEADYHRAVEMVSTWIDWTAQGRGNVASTQLPWKAMRFLLSQTIYGGRIDNPFDQVLLDTFVQYLFCESSFSANFELAHVSANQKALVCDATSLPELQSYVTALPDAETPEWLGLPQESQRMISTQHGVHTIQTLQRIQTLFDDPAADDDDSGAKQHGQPEWVRKLLFVEKLEKLITTIKVEELHASVRDTTVETRDPMCQYLRREIQLALRLTSIVVRDIRDVVEICNGTLKPTNHHRSIMTTFSKEEVPSGWKLYAVPSTLSLTAWVTDFSRRLERLQEFASQEPCAYRTHPIHIGSLFYPEAFITASRQSVARALHYPLEQLQIAIEIGDGAQHQTDGGAFKIVGISAEAAAFESGKFQLLKAELRTRLPSCSVVWRTREQAAEHSERQQKESSLSLPLYLNPTRNDVLCISSFAVDSTTPRHLWYQGGVSLVAWTEEQ
eukprot:PhM_4_TR3054/c0_g1_i1/m.97841/K10413/DYNC1H; dynein heavy chain 1, cytosolic